MALPLAPIAGIALRYGAVALFAYAMARDVQPGRRDQRAEDALDALPDGLSADVPRGQGQINATARLRRGLRLATGLHGWQIDAAILGRIRLRRI